jgi:3-dehydroquinate synthetase
LAPVVLYNLDQDVFRDLILHDKKTQNQAVNFIMLKKLGASFIQYETPVEKLWDEFKNFTALYPEFVELR